jgi:hypothetical protein
MINEEHQALPKQTATESAPDPALASEDQPAVILAELILDGRQVVGEIRLPGVSRRLVDILNAQDGYLTVHQGTLTEGSGRSLDFDTMQLTRRSIVIAFPHQGSSSRMDPGELIQKDRRLVTIILPGCELSGYFHVAPGIDPSAATTSVGNRFLVLTDATITIIDSEAPTRFEPVALLNATHVQAYVWSDEATSHNEPKHAAAVAVDQITEPAESPL